jgi:hypothetical protein
VARILRDVELDQRLEQDGYVVVPLLSAEEAERLRREYAEQVPGPRADGGMAFDYMQEDRDSMRRVTALLARLWEERLPQVFTDHRAVFSTFVHKRPGPESGMFLHDDRTYVDERAHRAHTIWVSLVDASPEIGNGCLYVVPGSHLISSCASGSRTPDWVRPYEAYLRRFLKAVPTRAGEAIVYDSKALHCSPPNTTETTREAIATAVAPRSARLVHVVADGDQRRVYAVDPSFFVEVHPHAVERDGMPPTYECIAEYVEPQPVPAPEAVAAACDPDDVPIPERQPTPGTRTSAAPVGPFPARRRRWCLGREQTA